MSIHAMQVRHGYLLCLITLPAKDAVLVQVGVSSSPLERARTKHRRRPHPHALLYAEMGSMGRARRGLSWLRRELVSRWVAQDGWVRVPASEGRAFRRLVHTAVDRYGTLEAKKAIQHVDLSEDSKLAASRNYRHSKVRTTMAQGSRATAEV